MRFSELFSATKNEAANNYDQAESVVIDLT
jgi:hypothetical protein